MMTTFSSITIIKFVNLYRDLAISKLTSEDHIIGRKNIICEIDESKFKKYENFWVVGDVERTKKKKCFFVITEDREAPTLRRITKQYIRPRSIVHTDHWKGYSYLDQLNITYCRVNYSKNRIQRGTRVHTNSVEGLWNGIKLNISTRNCSKQLLEKHLYEFIWRRKYRNNLFEAFINLLK
ncbi:Transposase, ISXO2-like domain-containing protein [Gigaspora margarita]|uniref:Transposase, ISXO2-like domain-containing protein n=1 Tax=Gigaspora margarita TaxID=4874 RepID=A0A8H4A0Q2_GIGMA|nr:Transposase, ISXO2-like domain-containing protein [Gigaspora margarita]